MYEIAILEGTGHQEANWLVIYRESKPPEGSTAKKLNAPPAIRVLHSFDKEEDARAYRAKLIESIVENFMKT